VRFRQGGLLFSGESRERCRVAPRRLGPGFRRGAVVYSHGISTDLIRGPFRHGTSWTPDPVRGDEEGGESRGSCRVAPRHPGPGFRRGTGACSHGIGIELIRGPFRLGASWTPDPVRGDEEGGESRGSCRVAPCRLGSGFRRGTVACSHGIGIELIRGPLSHGASWTPDPVRGDEGGDVWR